MPKGPQGQKRPADSIGCANLVARIAIGEVADKQRSESERSGLAGAKARSAVLTAEKRSKIAKAAAKARWSAL